MDVAGIHARHHGVDQDGSRLVPDVSLAELVDGFVATRLRRTRKGLEQDAQSAAEAENRTREKCNQIRGEQVEPAISVQEPLGRSLIRRLHSALELQSLHEGRRSGNVVEVTVRSALDDPPVVPIGANVAAHTIPTLEQQHFDATRYFAGSILDV